MAKKLIEAAVRYQKMGFSIIPVRLNKRPYIKWEQHQTEKAGQDQIRSWWEKWPSANIGIVTGKVSGLIVVDVDSQKGHDALNQFLPDNMIDSHSMFLLWMMY